MASPYNPFVEQRRQHLLRLVDLLGKHKGKPKEQVIAIFCISTGLKRDTVMQMVKEIEAAGIIEYHEKHGRGRTTKRDRKRVSKKVKASAK